MATILLVVGCVGGLLVLAIIGAAVFIMMQSGQRDTVSTAREGWIQRRSEKDEQGW